MIRRIASLAGLFAIELLALSSWLDTGSLSGSFGLAWAIGQAGPWVLRFVVLSTVLIALFGYQRAAAEIPSIDERLSKETIHIGYLAGHLIAVAGFALLSVRLYAGSAFGVTGNVLPVAWLLTGILAAMLAIHAFISFQLWKDAVRATGFAWLYAAAVAGAACLLGAVSWRLWSFSVSLTFALVKTVLGLFTPGVIADPATASIGTRTFSVEIDESCSGLEGIALMLVFSGAWLWLCRRDLRFPRALLLIPAGVAAVFLTNVLRIVALIVIGNAGAPNVALGGFHSQVGWIAFNAVAVGFALTSQQMSWVTVTGRSLDAEESAEDATTWYLIPFLAILAAAMIARAATAGFEWTYPLRLLAAGVAIWSYRHHYASQDWRFGGVSVAAGTLVFVLWIGLDWIMRGGAEVDTTAAALGQLSASARTAWLVSRILAAIVTVPIAEELAFRGFLVRRLMSADFEAVRPQSITWRPVLISSVVFGILHGQLWLAGAVAGIFYAGAYRWRGRLGDAVVAHAVTNALLTVWVVAGGHWDLW